MEFSTRWHRLLRAAAFGGGLAAGLAGAVFIFSNVAPVSVHWRIPGASGPVLDWTARGVSLWIVGIIPLLAGLAAGYLYHLPARLHHLRQHLRHRTRVHELEHELKELRTSLDKLLVLPDDRLTAGAERPAPVRIADPAIGAEERVVLKLPEPGAAALGERAAARPEHRRPEIVKRSTARPRANPRTISPAQ